MISGLIEKEFRQHRAMLLLIVVALATGFYILKDVDLLVEYGGSNFALLGRLLFWMFPLTCLVLGNALIAGEFRQKTQVFLDGLPMQRWHMLAVKYLFGLAIVLVSSSSLLGISFGASPDSAAMTSRFALLLWLKTLAWSWFCWAVLFAHSFLGKFRVPFGIVVVSLLIGAEQGAGLLVSRFGPFELVSERFAFERYEIPVQALWFTAALIVGFTCAGFALGLVRDATLATMLSEKMSAREKMASIAISILAMIMFTTAISRAEKTQPLQLPGSVEVTMGPACVSVAAAVVSPTEDETALLQKHADAAAELLADVAQYLGCNRLPKLYLIHRRDFKELELENGTLDSRQGCLIRLNVTSTPIDSVPLKTRILKSVLDANQHCRLRSDTRDWVLDGFSVWWPLKDKVTLASELLQQRSHVDVVQNLSVNGKDLRSWLKFGDNLDNDEVLETVAAVGVMELGRMESEGQHRFLKAVLGYEAPHDFRATVHDAWNNVPYLLRATLNTSTDALANRWTEALHRAAEVAGVTEEKTTATLESKESRP